MIDSDTILAMREIAENHGMSLDDILGRSHKKEIVAARREVAFFLVCIMGKSYPEAGRVMNRHHTTVMNLVDTDFAERKKDFYKSRFRPKIRNSA